jgi:hypothetical protein
MPKQISIDQDGALVWINVYPEAFSLRFSQLFVRFNRGFEMIDKNGLLRTKLDAATRSGDLIAPWGLIQTEIVKLEMDTDSFRIILADGTILRSPNLWDVGKIDLEQVDFWTPNPKRWSEDLPWAETLKHYPEILMQ